MRILLLLILGMGCVGQPLVAQTEKEAPVFPDTTYLLDQIYRVDVDSFTTNWGFYDMESKELLTSPIYDSLIYRYRTGLELEYYEIVQNGKYGLLRGDRSPWIDAKYDKLDYEYNMKPSRIFVRKGDLYGILNEDGSVWLAPVYEEILYDGYNYKVKKGGQWGILNSEGEVFIPICFEQIYEHRSPELSLVKPRGSDKRWSIFIWSQKSEKPCQPKEEFLYDRIEYFNEFFMVYKDGSWALVDRKGEYVLKQEYEEMKPFVFSYLRTLKVKKYGKYGLIRLDSLDQPENMTAIAYDEIFIDEESYKIKAEQNGKRDYIYDGEPYFDMQYEDVYYFLDHRLFTIKKGKKWGIAKENKEIIIEPEYDQILFLDTKTYMVRKGKKWGVVNFQNRELIPIAFTEFDYRPVGGYFFAAKKDKWGVVSLKKGVILPADYDNLIILPNRNFLVSKKGKTGIVGPGGHEIEPFEFVDFKYPPNSDHLILIREDKTTYKYRF